MIRKLVGNPDRFNFDQFIEMLLTHDSLFEMSQALTQECNRVEASMSGRGGPQARADGGQRYVTRLTKVGYWFHYGRLAPDGGEPTACRRLAEKLIAAGVLRPEALAAIRVA